MQQRLCFKSRKGGRTVQLVRHVYSPVIQRSQTLTIGALAMDADPEDFLPDLRLRPGVTLGEVDYRMIASWLRVAGDPLAARRRREAAQRIEARVRAEVKQELSAQSGDVFAQAVMALDEVTKALPELAEQVRSDGKPVRTQLRPGYLGINAAWNRLLKAAQGVGVAKLAKRAAKHEPTESISE